jgi:hypothetical protein
MYDDFMFDRSVRLIDVIDKAADSKPVFVTILIASFNSS